MSSPDTSDLCGTNSGYVRHGRAGTTPCPECREAHRTYTGEWRRRQGQPRVEAMERRGYLQALEDVMAALKTEWQDDMTLAKCRRVVRKLEPGDAL